MKRSWPCSPQTADETPDETTGETTSHLTKAASCQVIGYGYSHSADETTSHLTRLANDASQVIGYRLSKALHSHLTMLANALHSHSAKSPKDGDISRWLTPTKSLVNDNQVAGYRPRTCPLLIFALPPPDKSQ